MACVDRIDVVVAHSDRATLRVGGLFLKIDVDQRRADVEVEAMSSAQVPTPRILWRNPPVLALAALPGSRLGHLGEPSTASSAAWAAAGATIRRLHDASLPPWPGRQIAELGSEVAGACEWLLRNDVLSHDDSNATGASRRPSCGHGRRPSCTVTCRSTMCSSPVTDRAGSHRRNAGGGARAQWSR